MAYPEGYARDFLADLVQQHDDIGLLLGEHLKTFGEIIPHMFMVM